MKDLEFDIQKFVIVCVVIFLLGFGVGGGCGVNMTRKEAVTKGKAEYYLDKNNQRQWRWKE